MEGDSPQKIWTGKEVSYRHLKVFGCLAYVHVAKDERGKLDPNTRPCIFLDYGDDEFGYRVWDPVDEKVFRSWNIIFMEDKEDTHSRKWLSAMQDEMDSLHENHIYELVELPKGKSEL